MKNITFSVDENDLEIVRKTAAAENTTLNNLFREWIRQRARRRQNLADLRDFLNKAPYFTSKRKYTREEMNER